MRFSPRRRLAIDLLSAGILLFCCAAVIARFGSADDKPPPQDAKPQQQGTPAPKPRITISKKTTHILEPLDCEGYVDYLAALNQTASEGVTSENNAGVLLVRAIGVSQLAAPERVRFYKLLGVEPLPERGPYLTDFAEFVKDKWHLPWTEKADLDRATHAPWHRRELPLVDQWLKANGKLLELVFAATERPRCYLPIVAPNGSPLLAVPFLPCVEGARTASRLLVARAMLEIGEGKITEAERDLQACHRLARLCGRIPFLIPFFVANAIDAEALQGEAALIESGRLSAERALAYQQELRKLPPLAVVADVIERSERFAYLDAVSLLARERLTPSGALRLFVEGPYKGFDNLFARRSALNWDDALVFGNAQFDNLVAAARQSTVPARRQALKQFDQELRNLKSEIQADKLKDSLVTAIALGDLGRLMGKTLVVLNMPYEEAAFESQDRTHIRESLGQLGFALAAYHADHATYPDSLGFLAPKYVSRVPNDLYTEQPLRYRREGAGFLLYSVGQNGVDDGGRTFDSKPPGDDIVLKISGDRRKKQ